MENIKNIILKNVIVDLKSLSNESGQFSGVNIKFKSPSSEKIFLTSSKVVIHEFPEHLVNDGFNFDLKALIDFTSILNSGISTALFAIRRKMPNGGEFNIKIKSSLEDGRFLQVNLTKHFFREGNLGRNKVSLSFFKEDKDFGVYEEVQVDFTKKDIQILFALITEITSDAYVTRPYYCLAKKIDAKTGEELSDYNIPFAKVDNSVVFDDIWLHGQELFNLMFLADQLNYEFEIENRMHELNSTYRQIKIVTENGIANIILKKMNKDSLDEVKIDSYSGLEYFIKIPVSSYVLTLLSMFLTPKMLSHGVFEPEVETPFESKQKFSSLEGIKYHISTKESFIGLGYKYHKKHGESLNFAFQVKNGFYSIEDEHGEMDMMFEKKGEKFAVLESAFFSLREQWPKLIEAFSLAYTKKYTEWDKTSYMKKFFVTQNENGKWFKYEFSISSSIDNKAAGVLLITKYKMIGKEVELVSSFRQVLFKKYLYQLLVILLNMSSYFEKTNFEISVNKMDMIKYRFMSMKRIVKLEKKDVVLYGFKRSLEGIEWGIFSSSNNMNEVLTEQDLKLISISSKFRLLRGDWLPFVSDKICIGPDRFLTDFYGEFNLENKLGDGEIWASNMYFVSEK